MLVYDWTLFSFEEWSKEWRALNQSWSKFYLRHMNLWMNIMLCERNWITFVWKLTHCSQNNSYPCSPREIKTRSFPAGVAKALTIYSRALPLKVKCGHLYQLHSCIWNTVKHLERVPDSKVHEANMGPTWVLSAPDGLHVGPMNLAIRLHPTVRNVMLCYTGREWGKCTA